MSALMEREIADRGTGVDFVDWVRTYMTDQQLRTAQPCPAMIVYSGPSFFIDSVQGDRIEQVESVTDPDAQKRFVSHSTIELARGLSDLAFSAKLVIPGLRDITPAEQSSLQQYYKRLYRKA